MSYSALRGDATSKSDFSRMFYYCSGLALLLDAFDAFETSEYNDEAVQQAVELLDDMLKSPQADEELVGRLRQKLI